MARIKFVKKARKDHPQAGIKAGESYYTWSLMSGGRGYRKFSKTPPRPSQLTSSNFMQQYLGIGEILEDALQIATDPADLESARDEAVGEIESLKDETQGSKDNLPENLQESATGQLLQERVDNLENWGSELEGIDLDFSFEGEEPGKTEEESEEDFSKRLAEFPETEEYKEALEEWLSEKREELLDTDPGM
jgi:hypothetical protein